MHFYRRRSHRAWAYCSLVITLWSGLAAAQDKETSCPSGSSVTWDSCVGTTVNDGYKYVGSFKDGTFEGEGVYTTPSGDVLKGSFHQGLIEFRGVYTWVDGTRYTGTFRKLVLNGDATVAYASGDHFIGQYEDGRRNGLGEYVWSDGSKYRGSWVDGLPRADGVHYDQKAQVLSGVRYKSRGLYDAVDQLIRTDELIYALPSQ